MRFFVFLGDSFEKNVVFWEFCCEFGKEGMGDEMADNQCFYVYTSFIVRLSFVIGSSKVGKR